MNDVKPKKISPGMYEVKFSNYRSFFEFIQEKLLDYKQYIFRGQRDSSWQLKSTIDREMEKLSIIRDKKNTEDHLNSFILASRGRANSYFYANHNDDEWWALGQHYGLATPLLDWSESPFVGMFFAYEKEEKSSTQHRAVYAISRYIINKLERDRKKKSIEDNIKIITPISIDNSRLVNQRGLFLSMPPNTDVESYLKENINRNYDRVSYYKFIIPEKDREDILKYLNKMNISNLTLFPDLIGASEYVNMQLRIDKY